MDVHSKWFSNGDCLSRHVLPPAKERGGKVNVPLRFGATFTQSLLFWPTYHKHLVSLLEDCSLIHILKKSLKHNHYWAKINMSHQPDDDVKGTRFAYLDLVPDRIWWNIVAFPNIHHPRAVREQLEEVEYMCHCGRTWPGAFLMMDHLCELLADDWRIGPAFCTGVGIKLLTENIWRKHKSQR